MTKPIVFTIEYEVEAESCNMEEILDKLREYGAAQIIDVKMKEEPDNGV